MAKTLKKAVAMLLALCMALSLSVGIFAAETDVAEVTIALTPGKTTINSNEITVDGGTLIRVVNATTGEIIVAINDSYGELTAPQSALKFDRNSSSNQKAQKVARELYTDDGHFTNPASVTVADAPEGYPFKYVGYGDYSGHYVSHVRVIYERDDDGNALKDENGNYIIKELQHSGGTPLHYNGELTTNIDGPFHYATGTRAQQFLLMNEAGETFYGYCIDLETGAVSSSWYTLANLEDNNYYASEEAENHVRGIMFNGYWGTAEGEDGSLSVLKAALKAAIADGSVEDDYSISLVNRKKFTTGYELQEGEYHHGSYVYWTVAENQPVQLTDEIIDQMTEGEALDAMQAAIWSWANGSRATLDGIDGMVVGDLSVASSAMSDSLNGKNDPEGAARTRALYAYLMQQTAPAGSVIINDKTFANDMSLTLGEEVSANIYDAKLSFKTDFIIGEQDELAIELTYVDAYGNTQTIEKALTGEDALVAVDGVYTIDGLTLNAGQEFQFALNILGKQYLEKNAYIFTSEGGTGASQTMVSMVEGWHDIDVTKSVESSFTVKETFEPEQITPPEVKPEPPVADKTSKLTDREENRFEIEVRVPGEDGPDIHDEVILMVDGSYSGDDEWPAMKEAINEIGRAVLNDNGNTQLTLMAFGMGDNIVLQHIADADELAATLGSLPGYLLYGRSSTNCEVGFNGVAEYIENHDGTLNKVNVVYISDGEINMDETARKFFDWKAIATGNEYKTPIVNAYVAFEFALYYGHNVPTAVTTVFGDRIDGMSNRQILDYVFTGGATDEEFLAFMDEVYKDVYAHSGLYVGVEYPISVVERAFVKYDEDFGTFIQNAFYEVMYHSPAITYPEKTTRTIAAAEALAAMEQVSELYVVDTNSYSEWMDTGITSENSTFVQSNGIAGLCEALEGALTDLAKTPFNDVVVTDYMSKWVNLDVATLKIVDNSTGETIWSAADGWLIEENHPTAQDVPVIVELVDPADYEDGGADVSGNTSGDIYKLTWYVKDGAMLRSDTYSLKYDVIVDTAENGFVADTELPANGNTDLFYKDENGEDQTNEIKVPDVDAPTEEPENFEISFKKGQASNISFLLIDKATGKVEFLKKIDIEDETSFEIPAEEGKISAVFVKQSTSGMLWFSEEVDEEIEAETLKCVKKNNKSYKDCAEVAYGAGDVTWAFKKNKYVTYTFSAK
ncbi:MAG: VWA domain-containing protein [Clostridia bacterium]|nr:VWA domain-containing protein [Clostridia bacterium]